MIVVREPSTVIVLRKQEEMIVMATDFWAAERRRIRRLGESDFYKDGQPMNPYAPGSREHGWYADGFAAAAARADVQEVYR